ncbi:hypothetical protein [Leminorella grimontii]|uniref:hypothetical protein n=1 Tax=Leminorella grimontii TaxID=82981 RepID=UPI00322041D1
MFKALLSFLKEYWVALVIAAALAGLSWKVGFNEGIAGSEYRLRTANDQIHELQRQITGYEREKREATERHNIALAASVQKIQEQAARAEKIAADLVTAQQQLNDLKQKLKRRNHDAVKKDPDVFTGLGPDSLRAYRAALGYPDTGNLSQNPGSAAGHSTHAASAGEGLPPIDLLNHAADYGPWCMGLYTQLNQIKAWSEGK